MAVQWRRRYSLVRCNPSVSLGGVVVQAAASRGGIGVGEEERLNRAVVRVSVHVKAGSAQWSLAASCRMMRGDCDWVLGFHDKVKSGGCDWFLGFHDKVNGELYYNIKQW